MLHDRGDAHLDEGRRAAKLLVSAPNEDAVDDEAVRLAAAMDQTKAPVRRRGKST